MDLSPNSRLVMIGDSITDAGRSENGEATPWNAQQGLGFGYANLVDAHIQAAAPEKNIRITNRGISGNTVLDLEARWQEDVIDLQPDFLSVMIGINDVWRQCDIPLQSERHVSLDAYEAAYRRILESIRPKLKGLLLAKPFIIENNKQDSMRQLIDSYGTIVEHIAKDFDAECIDPQLAFDDYLRHRHSSSLAWDRIHPNTTGHLLIAQTFLKALNY